MRVVEEELQESPMITIKPDVKMSRAERKRFRKYVEETQKRKEEKTKETMLAKVRGLLEVKK